MIYNLPNFFIIPFVLLSGKLSVLKNKVVILAVALLIYLTSGIACFFAQNMTQMIIISCAVGVGCGLVIPLAAGLLSDFFVGKYRMQQLGIKSGIANVSLVIATLAVGAVGAKNWHLPFLVYLTPVIPLLLVPFLRNRNAKISKNQLVEIGEIDQKKIAGIASLYGFITYSIIVFSYYLPFLAATNHISDSALGIITSILFLAITLPGFILPYIIHLFKQYTNLISLLMIAIGLLLV
ncbi:MAG: MFS transporter, partial [Clostridiales bacterium]